MGQTHIDAAAAVKSQFAQEVLEIGADLDLTDDGRRRKMAKAWVEASSKVAKLRADHSKEVDGDREAVERRVHQPGGFGYTTSPSDKAAVMMSFRDAVDRVERAGRDEWMSLLEKAHRAQDDVLTRAIVSAAVEAGDLDVLNAHIEHHPDEEDDLRKARSYRTRTESFAEQMTLRGVAVPPLLTQAGFHTADQISELASSSSAPKPADPFTFTG